MGFTTGKIIKAIPLTDSGRIIDENGAFFSWGSRKPFNIPNGRYELQHGLFRPTNERPLFGAKRPIILNYSRIEITLQGTYVEWYSKSRFRIYLNVNHRSLPTYCQIFVICHEIGHTRGIKSESGCDAFALRRMIFAGYNPSQIVAASETLNFDKNRKQLILKELNKRFT